MCPVTSDKIGGATAPELNESRAALAFLAERYQCRQHEIQAVFELRVNDDGRRDTEENTSLGVLVSGVLAEEVLVGGKAFRVNPLASKLGVIEEGRPDVMRFRYLGDGAVESPDTLVTIVDGPGGKKLRLVDFWDGETNDRSRTFFHEQPVPIHEMDGICFAVHEMPIDEESNFRSDMPDCVGCDHNREDRQKPYVNISGRLTPGTHDLAGNSDTAKTIRDFLKFSAV